MQEPVLEKAGKKAILLGNQAIVRGALEAGVQFVSTYPGTPASDIGDTFYKLQAKIRKLKSDFYFEYSVNEKVALEAAMGASFSGLKCLVAMKDFGLNVCSDSLIPFVYMGSKGPTVIVVGDDPSCYSSAQSEQNSRWYSFLANIPTLEPSDPQDCKDFTKLAFEISEKFKIPVMIRTTTRVAHQRAVVRLEKLSTRPGPVGKFAKSPKNFITMPPRVLEMKKELFEKLEKIIKFSEKSKINSIKNHSPSTTDHSLGIITSGVSYLYVMEALKELNVDLPVLKLGFFYPLPEKLIIDFIQKLDKVLVVEELELCLEGQIQRLSKYFNPKLEIFGKILLPKVGELNQDLISAALNKILYNKSYSLNSKFKIPISKRSPKFCTGCPYWLVFSAIKRALSESKIKKEDVVFGGDIGCYMLAGISSVGLQDYLCCMGSSIGIGHGVRKTTNQKLIAFIGDSTFFHAGIPALINTVFNKSNPLIIILENLTTAMTGHQPHPGNVIKIEDIVRACGVRHLKTIDPVNQKEMIKTVKDFLGKKEVTVIISKSPCKFVKKS